jgi:DNA-binding XRE family transcriptional regulator
MYQSIICLKVVISLQALDNKAAGEKLARLRNKNGLLQKDVASSVGIKLETYSKYEQGNRRPPDKVKVKLADFFGVSVQELFFEV